MVVDGDDSTVLIKEEGCIQIFCEENVKHQF